MTAYGKDLMAADTGWSRHRWT